MFSTIFQYACIIQTLVGYIRQSPLHRTLYTDIMMQMQNALEKLALGLVFELDDRLESKC